jgi:hypothetical protein
MNVTVRSRYARTHSRREDWVQVNKSQPYIDLLYGAISEIEKSRDRIAAFTEILHKRIVIAHREPG